MVLQGSLLLAEGDELPKVVVGQPGHVITAPRLAREEGQLPLPQKAELVVELVPRRIRVQEVAQLSLGGFPASSRQVDIGPCRLVRPVMEDAVEICTRQTY